MPLKVLKGTGAFFAAICLDGLARLLAQAPPATPIFEEWSVVMVEGRRSGFESTITTAAGDGYRTAHTEEFVFKRMGARLKMVDISTVTEDARGAVLSFHELTEGSGSHIESEGRREGDDLIVSSRGQTRRYHLPALAALGPEAVRRLSHAVPLRAGQTFSFPTFSSDYPQGAVLETGTVDEKEERDVLGKTRSLWRISSQTSIMPGVPLIGWVDDQAEDVEQEVTLPGLGTLHEYVTDRATCMKQPEGAEIFSTNLIRPSRAIPHPEQQARAVYRLTLASSADSLDLWNGDEQRVLSSGPGTATVEINAPDFTASSATWKLPHADDPAVHVYLQPTSYLEVDAPKIQALARQAVGAQTNPVLAAKQIETFVRGYITKKDLNIGFASAEETAESREGDCTEHAVLCAALGRAAGLPTRCVLGFGYIPPEVNAPTVGSAVGAETGIFAFHMWAEAWIGPDEWVPMDAALDGFDIGHIAITKTALDDVNPLVDLDTPVLHLLEHLKIEVVKTVPKVGGPAPLPASTGPD